jgi:hypothetical protein
MKTMKKYWKNFRRSLNIGKGRWKVAGKIPGDLRRSGRVDGKLLERIAMNSRGREGMM